MKGFYHKSPAGANQALRGGEEGAISAPQITELQGRVYNEGVQKTLQWEKSEQDRL
jgi:hypothetical protein